ncbi:hypothetical protein D8I24_2666 (plasmid) [Cupriavidus necator H850]|nr:hypothetical protein D8I24_2666 [Cupriavidus necator H850]
MTDLPAHFLAPPLPRTARLPLTRFKQNLLHVGPIPTLPAAEAHRAPV